MSSRSGRFLDPVPPWPEPEAPVEVTKLRTGARGSDEPEESVEVARLPSGVVIVPSAFTLEPEGP